MATVVTIRRFVLVVAAAYASATVFLVAQGSVRQGPESARLGSPETGRAAAFSGTVVDGVTGAAIPGALVNLGRSGTSVPVQSVIADSKGRFVFVQLAPDTKYTLSAVAPGFVDAHYAGPSSSGPARRPIELYLSEGQWRPAMQIRMWRSSTISGVVLDDMGEPLVGVPVRAYARTSVHGRSYLAGSALAVTDDRGWYRLPGLKRDSYVVAVVGSQSTVSRDVPEVPQRLAIGELVSGGRSDREGQRFVSGPTLDAASGSRLVVNSLTLPPAEGSRVGRSYQPVFFPSTTDPDLAQSIAIGDSETVSGIDFRLRPVEVYRVSGRVVGVAPTMLPLLRLLPFGYEHLGLGSEVATTTVGADGTFEFLAVPTGQYTLDARPVGLEFVSQTSTSRVPDPAGYASGIVSSGTFPRMPTLSMIDRTTGGAPFWAQTRVAVSSADVVDLIIEPRPAASIRGRIELVDGASLPASQSQFWVNAEPANGDPTFGRRTANAGRGQPGDEFVLDGLLPGTYLLAGSHFPVRSVTWRGRDVSDVGIDASAGGTIEDVVVTLTGATTEVSGTVSGAPPETPLAVIAFPADQSLWPNYGWTPRRLRSVVVGGDGSYSIRNLPEGEYLLIAVDAALSDAWVDPRFLKEAAVKASRIRLSFNVPVTQPLERRTVPVGGSQR